MKPIKIKKKARALSKTTAGYWSQKVYLETKGDWQSANFFVRVQALGDRRKLRLESCNREDASREALARYLEILSKGWPTAPGITLDLPEKSTLPQNPSIGDWIEMARKKSKARPESMNKYAESLRTIAGEILGMSRARKPEQRNKINALKISELSKETLDTWHDSRMARAKKLDFVQESRAQNTVRSLIANAKALFTDDVLEAIGASVDNLSSIPFRRLKLPPKNKSRYTSRFDPTNLLLTAAAELGSADPDDDDEEVASRYEQWKILYLALVAGLRYNEIDRLRVQEIFATAGRIFVRPHGTFRPKTDASEGEVLVSSEASMVLCEMLKHTKGQWFIKDGPSKHSPSYRASIHHERLLNWLRNYQERGFKPLADVHKPIHELRKEAGTLVNKTHGLNEAKNFLRHSSIATTAEYYVGTNGNITTGLA
jgi:integrase